MEEVAVGAGSDFVDDCGLEVDEDCAGDEFTGGGVAEESL